ncbi:MAG: multiheme c-type cytochrome [Fuerstiella sp.]|nr:multiheme c-type cytochrome [Fuerstiella sp.]
MIFGKHTWHIVGSAVIGIIVFLMLSVRPVERAPSPTTTEHAAEPPILRPAKPKKPTDGFVGSRTCVECHAEISEQFAQHPMGQSMRVAGEDTVANFNEHSTFAVDPSPHFRHDLSYAATRVENTVFHCETALDRQSGDVVYHHDVPVHFAVGSGKRGRSYITNRAGVMLMSPVTWYTAARRWDLSPGYKLQNLHFNRRIVDGCVQCHADRVAQNPESTHLFQKDPFPELAIGCERCHGPGESHVNAWTVGNGPTGEDPIVNPAKLSGDLRDHVCFQCHLIGESRLLRYGRSDFDFRPGDHITDIWTTFVQGSGIDSQSGTKAVRQVGQMLSSRCHLESGGHMGCTSCHDPHRTPKPAEKHSFFRSKCLTCHDSEKTECSKDVAVRNALLEKDSCITCHMPATKANDVPHTSLTDHRILKHATQSTAAFSPKTSQLEIFGLETGSVPPAEIERATALKMVQSAEATGNQVVAIQAIPTLEEWVQAVPDDLPAVDALGTAYSLADELSSAQSTWEAGLKLAPRDERFLRQLFYLYHDSGQLEKALQRGTQLIQVNPWDYEYHGRLAHILGQTGRIEDGIRAAKQALEVNPSAYQVHGWLAEVYARRNDPESSQRHRDLCESLAPVK